MNNTCKLHDISRGILAHIFLAGSYALLGAKVPRDSTVARKLRDAGAILLGKTSLSEWAGWRSLNTSNGWSALGGQVYGPYFPHEDPWGSSSGSAVASA
jgi:amidase